MQKAFLLILALAVVGLGWYLLSDSPVPYEAPLSDTEATFEDEVTALETELHATEAQMAAGTMSEDDATEAKVRILTRLNQIDSSSQVEMATLTPSQRAQLSAGLERLRSILITYQATLISVDELADDAEVAARMRSSAESDSAAVSSEADVTTSLSGMADDIANALEELQETLEEIIANEEAAMNDAETEEETSTSTDDEAEMTDEEAEGDMTEPAEADEASVIIDTEAELNQ